MRISADPKDSGYALYQQIGPNVKVLLDGVEHKWVITADEEQGYIVVCDLDEHDSLIPEGDGIRTSVMTGTVRIEKEDSRRHLAGIQSAPSGCDTKNGRSH